MSRLHYFSSLRIRQAAGAAMAILATLVAGCGGGNGSTTTTPAATSSEQLAAGGNGASPAAASEAQASMSQLDAVRLADQASFGPTEALVASIRSQGAARWIGDQMLSTGSRYTSGQGDAIHRNQQPVFFCDLPAYAGTPCWRDWYSSTPLLWDFYRNALGQPDQLRQRVAFALQQILVVSNVDVQGTYGLRQLHNMLLDNAFGNYRQVLRELALSPVMGDYLNNVNNDRAAPNENFARELLQLFTVGTCELNPDATLKGGRCTPTYDNATVRNYAFALTGWTYPPGGVAAGGCWPAGLNCRYYGGNMVPVAAFHDAAQRPLLSGVSKAAGSQAPAALEAVLDSLFAHPNIAPFVGRQLIQFLVSSNPSPAYVQRVAAAFDAGRFESGGRSFGAGAKGDLAATVAAVLLDAEARGDGPASARAGRLREPVQMMAGVLRALDGTTDGDALGWWWGEVLRQHVFRAPSVFNFYPADYPVPGTAQNGAAFGIHNANGALQRMNFLSYLLDMGGSPPAADVPRAVGTRVRLDAFLADADDAGKLVDRLSLVAIGQALPAVPRDKVIDAVNAWTPASDAANWRVNRVRTAAYLVFASPNYQLQR